MHSHLDYAGLCSRLQFASCSKAESMHAILRISSFLTNANCSTSRRWSIPRPSGIYLLFVLCSGSGSTIGIRVRSLHASICCGSPDVWPWRGHRRQSVQTSTSKVFLAVKDMYCSNLASVQVTDTARMSSFPCRLLNRSEEFPAAEMSSRCIAQALSRFERLLLASFRKNVCIHLRGCRVNQNCCHSCLQLRIS